MASVRRQFSKQEIVDLHREVLDAVAELEPPAELLVEVYRSVCTMAGQHEVVGLAAGLPAMAIPRGH